MTRTILLLAPALLASAPAAAADWWLLTTTDGDHRTVLYIDAASLSEQDGHQLVWLERVYETRSEYGAKRARSRVEVDCATRLIGSRELRSFDDRGDEVPGNTAVIAKVEMTPVSPGTVYDSVLAFVCDGNRDYDHLAADLTPLADSREVFEIIRERERGN